MNLFVRGTSRPLTGEITIPVSKYHAHRALVLASLAPGRSVVHGVSRTRQLTWTVACLRALGTDIRVKGDDYIVEGGRYHTRGVGFAGHESSSEDGVLNVGSSGTTLYFLTGLASLADRPVTLRGMKYFQRRPIRQLLEALAEMGVELSSADGRPPVTVQPRVPRGGHVSIPGTLSQWLSGLLLLAPFAEHETTISVTGGVLNEQPYVDLTVRMMRHWGLVVEHSDDWLTYTIPPAQTPTARDYTVPPDIGSAAFPLAATGLHPSDVLFRGLRATSASETDHPEAEFLDIAAGMGLPMTIDEETGFVRVRHDGLRLRAFDVDARPIPDLLPVLSTLASVAEGTSRLHNVHHIRLKESDRVDAMMQLNSMGGELAQTHDELTIRGVRELSGAALSSYNDHRVLMSLALAGSRAHGLTSLTYPHAYRISYPNFIEDMTTIGLSLEVADTASIAVNPSEGPAVNAAVRARLAPPTDLLTSRVAEMAVEAPDAPAVIEVGARPRTTSWGDLQEEADRISTLLLRLGVGKGDAVAFLLPNWTECVAVSLATLQIGAVAAPIMPVFGEREVAMVLARSKAKVLFVPEAFRRRAHAAELPGVVREAERGGRELRLTDVIVLSASGSGGRAERVPGAPAVDDIAAPWRWHDFDAAVAGTEPDRDAILAARPSADDVCQLLFTSGTTGEPKGVQHTHHSLRTATELEIEHLGLTAEDRIYVPSPIAHQTGFLYGMLLAWRLGVAAVVQPIWDPAIALREAFGEAGATFVQAATPFLMDLVKLVEEGAAAPESLRIFVATGAAVPRTLAEKATRVLDTAVCGAFGTTETGLATLAAPQDPPDSAWGSDGRTLPGIRIRVVDDEDREVPPGVEGHYEIFSPTLFAGYLDRPDLTAAAMTADGWYRTGDLATVDEKGFLRITGRLKDVINRGGEKIPVVEIENLLFQHPQVADVAIVGMPDERLGERACAFVVPADGAEPLEFGQMQEYLRQAAVSKYYWPERLEIIDALPRNAVGKVLKNVLRERAAELVAR